MSQRSQILSNRLLLVLVVVLFGTLGGLLWLEIQANYSLSAQQKQPETALSDDVSTKTVFRLPETVRTVASDWLAIEDSQSHPSELVTVAQSSSVQPESPYVPETVQLPEVQSVALPIPNCRPEDDDNHVPWYAKCPTAEVVAQAKAGDKEAQFLVGRYFMHQNQDAEQLV